MDPRGWGEILFTIAVTVGLAVPLGAYLARVWQGGRTWLDPVLRPVEGALYWSFGIDAKKSQSWFGYTVAMLVFSAASFVVLYLILRFQDLLPMNPQGFKGASPDLAFNTAISFITNTNWRSYTPEQTLSAFSQMAGLTSHNFLSAAAGIAMAAAVSRAFAANRAEGLGNFWVDLTRISLYVLLPLSIVIALVFVGLGEPQTLAGHVEATGIEGALYWSFGVDAKKSQTWLGYTVAMLVFSLASFGVLYLILRFQDLLPLNPQGFKGASPDLAFNTAISFVTNTNWQSYTPEQTMSAFSQMAGLTSHNFLSAAAGIAMAAAVARAFAANRGTGLGNFWVDLTRISLYILLPFSIVIALAYVALGMPQTLALDTHGAAAAVGMEGGKQTIMLYPTASQEAIKQLGTNGGGIFNANSAHPYENPSAITNFIEEVSMNVLGYACVFAFRIVALAKKESRALVVVMAVFILAAASIVFWSETQPAPAMHAVHASTLVNMEGKEVRFGAPSTAVWTAFTTGASDGGVNAMHDSYMPLGGGVAMFMIQLGEMLPGGVGSGLHGMVVMAIIAVFVAGLMVGRTPEYLGKKIEAREVKFAMLAVLILPLSILGFAAVAAVLPVALKGL
ncbi:MAG TPA: potassium-transporting ATPase subunit KdpA, partial [Caulobacteraceae bacterium]|nr:potassium-transporting ATPase subunit KdpA [Caulobacteraceae bacterium]